MTRTHLVAQELQSIGFETLISNSDILISLKNRKVSQMEVEMALEQIFETIQFRFFYHQTGVIVRV